MRTSCGEPRGCCLADTPVGTRHQAEPGLVHLARPATGKSASAERLPLEASSERMMGVDIRKVTLPVAAGRNLAVLTEAAVRNYVLQLRGFDSTREFIARQSDTMKKRE